MKIVHAETIDPPVASAAAGETLSAEADHRIGNNLALIAAMIRLQANEVGRRKTAMPVGEVRELLTETAGRIEAVGRLHRRLSATGGGAVLDVGEYIREIATAMVTSIARSGTALISFDLQPACALCASQVLPLGLIIGEVVSNAIKYAHPSGLPTVIGIRCWRHGRGLNVEVNDDGVGLPEDFDPKSGGGLGLRLIRSLSDQLGATANFHNLPLGMRFSLNVPK